MTLNILIPLDGSKLGEAALLCAEELLSKLSPRVKIELTLLQVVPLLAHYITTGEVMAPVAYTGKEMAQIQRQARSYLHQVAKGIRSEKISVEIMVETGSAAEEIIKAADGMNVDLIAMSTHGRHGISRWAFGSVADKVLRGGAQANTFGESTKKDYLNITVSPFS